MSPNCCSRATSFSTAATMRPSSCSLRRTRFARRPQRKRCASSRARCCPRSMRRWPERPPASARQCMLRTEPMPSNATPPLVVHVVHRFGVGGLENGVVNLINRMPRQHWRHAVLALTEVSTEFARRVERSDVRYIELAKPPGHLVREYPRLYRLFRQLKPAIVHTRNLAALEASVPAWAAGVPVRVHGEHGWDVNDPAGRRRRYRYVRRLYRPFVTRYIALSRHLEEYLERQVGIASQTISQINNGVDTERFCPSAHDRPPKGQPGI